MKQLSILLLIFLSCLTACHEPAHIVAASKLQKEFVNQSCRERNLFSLGAGGSFLDDIKKFDFLFYSYEKMNVNEARELIVERTERLLELINSDINVQPYLHKFPYDYTDVEVSVLFVEENKPSLFASPPFLATAYLSDGMLRYAYYDFCKEQLERVHDEPYQRAIGILEHQRDVANLPPELR